MASSFNNTTTYSNTSLDDVCDRLTHDIELYRDPFLNRANVRYTLIICYSIISCFGAIGNLLVITAVLHNPSLRMPRNYFVINLAFSDFIMCTITVPFTMVYLLDLFWQLGDALCRVVASMQCINVFASTLSITAISLDRYLMVIFPTNPRLHRLIPALSFAAIWIFSMSMALPMFSATSVIYPLSRVPAARSCDGLIERYPMCREQFSSKYFRIGYTLTCFAFQYFLPLATVAGAYIHISLKLRKRLTFRTGTTATSLQRRRNEEQRQSRTNILILLIVFIFAICWLPLNIYITMVTFNIEYDRPEAFAFCHMLSMLSACANPILYGVLNETFRREFLEILGIRKLKEFVFRESEVSKNRLQQRALLSYGDTTYMFSKANNNGTVTTAIRDKNSVRLAEAPGLGNNKVGDGNICNEEISETTPLNPVVINDCSAISNHCSQDDSPRLHPAPAAADDIPSSDFEQFSQPRPLVHKPANLSVRQRPNAQHAHTYCLNGDSFTV